VTRRTLSAPLLDPAPVNSIHVIGNPGIDVRSMMSIDGRRTKTRRALNLDGRCEGIAR
jgi:hypothetical protein